jgi:glycosyltransferase involved in cell wall biosynthesis
MRSHDVMLFPTLDESLGWVAVEAGFASLPVITTDIFAIPELVVDGRTGVLIPLNKNDLSRWVGLWLDGATFAAEVERTFATMREHIGRALMGFVDNPASAAEMGAASKAHIEGLYGYSRAQRQLADLYANALGR